MPPLPGSWVREWPFLVEIICLYEVRFLSMFLTAFTEDYSCPSLGRSFGDWLNYLVILLSCAGLSFDTKLVKGLTMLRYWYDKVFGLKPFQVRSEFLHFSQSLWLSEEERKSLRVIVLGTRKSQFFLTPGRVANFGTCAPISPSLYTSLREVAKRKLKGDYAGFVLYSITEESFTAAQQLSGK